MLSVYTRDGHQSLTVQQVTECTGVLQWVGCDLIGAGDMNSL